MELRANKQPFAAVPDLQAWYPSETMEESDRGVFQCLDRGEGVSLVFGESGVGKTLLLNRLAEKFSPDDLVIISTSRMCDAKSFLQQMLYTTHQTWCGCTENELRLIFRDFIEKSQYARIILLLDDAQFFRYSIYEDLRSLIDIRRDNQAYVRIVLVGTKSFEERLTHPKLSSFQQRVIARFWLEPFNYTETKDYLSRELSRLISDSNLYELCFSKEAVKFIYNKTEGVPRLINHLGRASINILLHELEQKNSFDLEITERLVQKAWCIIQQIPDIQKTSDVLETHFSSESIANSDLNSGYGSHQEEVCLADPEVEKSVFSKERTENNDLREDNSKNLLPTKLVINTTTNSLNESSSSNSIEFGDLLEDKEIRDFRNILPENGQFSEKFMTDNSSQPNKSEEKLEKKSIISDELSTKTDSLFLSEESKESSFSRSDGIIEFGILEPEGSLSNENLELLEKKEDRKQESPTLSVEITPQLKAAEVFGEDSSEVWDFQLNPQSQGAVLSREEKKAIVKNITTPETEKSILEGGASLLPVDDEVIKRVKFVPSDLCSDISFTPRVQEKILDKTEFSFHNGHDLNDLVMPCVPDRIIDKLQKIEEFGDCSRSEIFHDLGERDFQIEKAHSVAFEQERLDEEKRKEEGHEARINSVFKQIYDQKK